MNIRSTATAGLLTLLLLTTGCKEQEVSRTSEGTLYVGAYESTDVVERVVSPGTRKLILEGHAGSVNLRTGDTDVARLSITRKARGNSPTEASENLAGLDIIEEGDEAAFRYRFAAKKPELSRYVVTGEIPAGTPLAIEWTSGSVSIDGFTEDVDVRTINGDVGFIGTSSKVRLQTRNGDVRGAILSMPPTVPADTLRPIPAINASYEFTTANGDVVATIPASLSVHIDAITSAGEIRAASLPFVDERFGTVNAGARFTARLAAGNGQLKLATQHGSVHIRESVLSMDRPGSPAADTTASVPASRDEDVRTNETEADGTGAPVEDVQPGSAVPRDTTSAPSGAPADVSRADTVRSSSS
ncbi:MAG: DUF4097 family beta strand repeat protein [Rhodothermia bacterium]|nr:DUF4097 family beta strand repeat protein [Rhodothermia bacterium]